MRPTNLIVIHCSASPNRDSLFRGSPGTPGFITPVQEIDRWHAERGFHRGEEWLNKQNPGLKAIGYHFLIYRSGAVVTGRHVDEVGAHVQGWNMKSLGICLVGTDQFTAAQWDSLAALVAGQMARLTRQAGPADRRGGLSPAGVPAAIERSGIRVCGHRDIPKVAKACPGFSVSDWLASGLQPLSDHLFEEKP
ncbi:MAG TPA: N-acetylmuramoyl-L-alanine amidase [Rhodocyclaceae bacterium]|nr:N-acetylmuramoyl-L-alanine amidase [Rhodocyclaceae bacterium]